MFEIESLQSAAPFLALSKSFLPAINASLNGLAGVCLVIGVMQVKKGKLHAHQKSMMLAFIISSVFLLLYVTDKVIKKGAHTPFNGSGIWLGLYYTMLLSHILLAISVPVFAIWLIRLGQKMNLDGKDGETDIRQKHRKLGKIAFPIWMYVSITGVLIYLALYPFNPEVSAPERDAPSVQLPANDSDKSIRGS